MVHKFTDEELEQFREWDRRPTYSPIRTVIEPGAVDDFRRLIEEKSLHIPKIWEGTK